MPVNARPAEKRALRRELLARRAAFTPAERRVWDEALRQALCAAPRFCQADTVLGYYPIGGEPDLRPALALALWQGKKVALPRCGPAPREMAFFLVESLKGLLPGAHGIPEPPPGAPPCPPPPSGLLLVPGVAFDLEGRRLGYGGGYYDRFLSRLAERGPHTLGICYDALLCGALPCEPHDVAVESVLTEKGGTYARQPEPAGKTAL